MGDNFFLLFFIFPLAHIETIWYNMRRKGDKEMSTKLVKICSRLSSEKGSHLWVVSDGFFVAGYSDDFFVAAKAADALNVHFRSYDSFKVCEA